MNGELAQLIFLAAHGNATLAGPDGAATSGDEESLLRFVEQLSFARLPGAQDRPQIVALSGVEWFAVLRRDRVRRLYLVPLSRTDDGPQLAAPIAGGSAPRGPASARHHRTGPGPTDRGAVADQWRSPGGGAGALG